MNPIEESWQRAVANTRFCCDVHRNELKSMYFTGAMAALRVLTGNWNPMDPSKPLTVDADKLAAVSKELTGVFHFDQDAVVDVDACKPVRH